MVGARWVIRRPSARFVVLRLLVARYSRSDGVTFRMCLPDPIRCATLTKSKRMRVLDRRRLLTIRELRFHLLGQHGRRSEAAHELKTGLRHVFDTALVGRDRRGDIVIPPGNGRPTVDPGQGRRAVRHPACVLHRARAQGGPAGG